MSNINYALRILLFVATASLVVNDWVRLLCTFQQESQLFEYQQQEEKNETGAFSLFEEEVKHKESSPTITIILVAEEALEAYIAHLIKDDDVRHLAYLPVFSPPPDLA